MYVKTVEIGFYEPYTGIWVKGGKQMAFIDERDETLTIDRWRKVLNSKYNHECYVCAKEEDVK